MWFAQFCVCHYSMIMSGLNIASATVQQITHLYLECFPYQSYWSDLRPCDYHVLWLLKEAVGEKKFNMDAEIKENVHSWLQGQSEDFVS